MSPATYSQINNLRLYAASGSNRKFNIWGGFLPGPDFEMKSFAYPYELWKDQKGIFLFTPQAPFPPQAPEDASVFLKGLHCLLPRLVPNGGIRMLWISNPEAAWQSWQFQYLKALLKTDSGESAWQVTQPALFEIGPYVLAINAGATMSLVSDFTNAIKLEASQVSFMGPSGVYPAKEEVSIPLFGKQMGAFTSCLHLSTADLNDLNVKLRYATTSPFASSSVLGLDVLDFQVFEPAADSPEVPMKLSFDPLNPLNSDRNYLGFFPYMSSEPGIIRSSFRTLLGTEIYLQPRFLDAPLTPARLVFNSVPAAEGETESNLQYYLVPDGPFALTTKKGDQATQPEKLLCGLSGVEYIEFSQNDLLYFHPGQKAGIRLFRSVEGTMEGLGLSGSTYFTTAWAMILPGNSEKPSKRAYFSEPDQAPLFSNEDDGKRNLTYFPYSRVDLCNAYKPLCFPLVPYQGLVQPVSSFGRDAENIASFEFQVLNPKRQTRIAKSVEKPAVHKTNRNPVVQRPASPNDENTTYALTPQGYRATFVNGKWTGISIANASISGPNASLVSRVNVEFGVNGSASELLGAIQNAFLTNQQFLVMSANIGGNLDGFTASIMLSEWRFGKGTEPSTKLPVIEMPASTAPGNYTNVFLFKSGNATVKQMARQPKLWTQYDAFNDKTSDPNGLFLSGWLLSYLEEAEKLYDHGNGSVSLGHFCELINDPNWNGFLALKVAVDQLASLPVDVQALIADISGTLYAHHLGNAVNHISAPDQSSPTYDISSPCFGLIHYVNPQFASQINHLPAYVQNSSTYNFTVLTLEVTFKKNLETQFANKCMLLLNRFFGDQVQRSNASGQQGANNLIIIGSYHEVDQVPTYSFSTAQGVVTDFYLNSNAFNCIRISKVTMNVTKLSGSSEATNVYKASFAIRGSFQMLNDAEFDLLSYEYLPFYGLTLEVTIQHGKPNLYNMDTAGLRFEKNPTLTQEAGQPIQSDKANSVVRTGSLVAQFPLKIRGLARFVGSVNGQNKPDNASPQDMGYRLLETATPGNITFSSPTNGEPWYGLEFDLVLGSEGALAGSGVISASMILAWTPWGQGNGANASPQFKLSGPGGVSLSFDFEGVLKFGAKDLLLNRHVAKSGNGNEQKTAQREDYFYLVFESIGLSLLGISFPPGGTTNLVLMGDTSQVKGSIINPTLSWFGGYAKEG